MRTTRRRVPGEVARVGCQPTTLPVQIRDGAPDICRDSLLGLDVTNRCGFTPFHAGSNVEISSNFNRLIRTDQLTLNQRVKGSNPLSPTNKINALA